MNHGYAQQIDLTCSHCNYSFSAEAWLLMDLAKQPELLPRLQAGDLHIFACPACDQVVDLDAPLLIYRPAAALPLLFSPAQSTTAEQDQEQAAGLLGLLQERLGDAWQEVWLAEGLPGLPRPFLAAALSDDPEAALRDLVDQAQEAIGLPEPAQAQALADSLVAWIQQETLDDAEAYLREHEADLLTDEAAVVMQMLVQSNSQNPTLADHQQRLNQARALGIAAMYAAIRRQRQHEGLQQAIQQGLAQVGHLGQVLWAFLADEDDDKAANRLQSEANTLLTLDAGQLFEQLIEAVGELGDEQIAARWTARWEVWQTAYQARLGRPLRPTPVEAEPRQTQPESWTDREEQQTAVADRGSKYTIISAHNSAIGDNALVINNIGQLPLRWKRPSEGDPTRARAAVGREAELAELHQRLLAGQNAALVSRGTSAALRGQPSIGKTTLAAMYVDRYGDQYPGGVFWLTVGPALRTADSVTPILQRMAGFAYDADLQAQTLLANTVFAAERVRALLAGHGALLAVIDDVWDAAALREIQAALPADAFTLLTTRDYNVAYALEDSPAVIQQLDVLSPEDARLLLQRGAPGLPQELADRVASGLGRHAHALSLAAGALKARKAHRYGQTAAELLQRVAAGQGFGDLPRMDQAERLTPVEVAAKYSYDYLGEGAAGADWQAQFRGLGALAQEAEFNLFAASALWERGDSEAEEFLLLLDGLSLIQETDRGGRWRQHAILRAYALSLQTTEERAVFPERHADYFISLTQQCHESKPRDYARVEQEFAQIQHAFSWCEQQSPRRATRLTLLLNDFMRNRGRVPLLNQWLQTALQGAEIHGDRLGKANTLKSLGDLERR
ncbi:MAG: hypothetical protein KC441_18235, partial [Anaerolineales bacterium]|nr:hypothetical protein [Anaerolineales bacterium]